ncbi:MAG: HupE/UreJ family protein [Rhizobiaceae bacterium]
MKQWDKLFCLLFLVAAFFAAPIWGKGKIWAHEIQPSIMTLKLGGDRKFTLEVRTNLEALIANVGPDEEDTDDAPEAALYDKLRKMDSVKLNAEFKKFAPSWVAAMGLFFEGSPAKLKLVSGSIPEVGDLDLARESTITMQGEVPSNAERLSWAYPEKYGASVLRIERPGQKLQAEFFRAGVASEPINIEIAAPKSGWQKFWDYMVLGYTHILPKGLDHILFVVGLFLLSVSWRPLLTQITAFTLAHSITLGLGLYGVVNISPSIVEPLIALSIVYVAIENIFTRKLHIWRPVIVFLFGLLHGLGFAGILTEIGLPRADFLLGLVAFNVGVELGQLTVIGLAFLAVGWFVNKSWYRARITIPASLAIAAMGAWWLIERTVL